MDRSFDRLIRFDQRSRDYPATLGFERAPLRSYSWNFDPALYLDQGPDGACVGFAWAHALAARPVELLLDAAFAETIYKQAQLVDEYPGEAYSGTSVLAGAKTVAALLEEDLAYQMLSYRWAFGIEDCIRVLGYKGPCVLGVGWLADMMDVDENGFIHASGSLQGNHAVLARGVKVVWRDPEGERDFANLDVERSYVTIRNSWGQLWGLDGDCRVSVLDLSTLLEQDGECCIPDIKRR